MALLTAGPTTSASRCPIHGNTFSLACLDVIWHLYVNGTRCSLFHLDRGLERLERKRLCVNIWGDEREAWLEDQ